MRWTSPVTTRVALLAALAVPVVIVWAGFVVFFGWPLAILAGLIEGAVIAAVLAKKRS